MTVPTRRHAAAAQWTAGEDRLRLLLDGTADHAIVMLGVQGMVLTWNAGAVEIIGYAAEEIVGQHFSALYPQDAVERALPQAHLELALSRGRFEEEGWRVRKDGTRFWASTVITPLRDRSGRLRGFGKVTRDLSDRLRAQDLHAVLDAASDAILGVDESGAVMFANDAACAVFGYERSDLIGRPIEALIPSEFREQLVDRRQEYSSSPTPRRMGGEMTLGGLRRDGSAFPAEISLSSVDTSRGLVITTTVRDVTVQLASQEQGRREEERRRATGRLFGAVLAACTGHVILGADAAGRICLANRGAEVLLGYGPGGLVGLRPEQLYDPAELLAVGAELQLDAGQDPFTELVLRGFGPRPRRWTCLTRSGERRAMDITLTPVGDSRQPDGYVVVGVPAADIVICPDEGAMTGPISLPPDPAPAKDGASASWG